MTKAVKKEHEVLDQHISELRLDRFAVHNMKEYGTYTIEQRAVPDERDGLKPVQRRSLWSMYKEGMRYNTGYKKAARTVGDVIGKYHPHGDTSVYEAIVNMANMSYNPVDGQGNWGEFNTLAAHYRYCFAAGTLISTSEGIFPIESLPSRFNPKAKGNKISLDHLKVESIDTPENAAYWINSGIRRIYSVSTEINNVRTTSNEPFLVLNSKLEYVWKTVTDLQVGDKVAYQANPKIDWPKGQQTFVYVEPTLRETCVVFPKQNSPEFMRWLGWVTSEGSLRPNTVNFCNSDNTVIDEYVALCKTLFGNIEPSIHWVEPTKYEHTDRKVTPTKAYAQVNLNSQHLGRWLEANGIKLVTASFKEVQDILFTANKKEAVAFLQSLFEGDGSINVNHVVSYTSNSRLLLKQLSNYLLIRFGIPCRLTKAGNKSSQMVLMGKTYSNKFLTEIGFLSIRKNKKIQACSYGKLNSIPELRNYVLSWRKPANNRSYVNEQGEIFSKYSIAGIAMSTVPIQLEDFKEWWSHAKHQLKEHFNTLFNTIEKFLTYDYILCKVTKIRVKNKANTYDLSVPATKAYTANGIIVHNTEMRLSQYAEKVFFSAPHLEVSDLVNNYDGSEKEILVLPSLLPNLLINGAQGMAVGIVVGIPPFKLKGVCKIMAMMLEGTELKPKHLNKYLELNYPYGGTLLDPERLKIFMETGQSAITLLPDHVYDPEANSILITGGGPNFEETKVITKLQEFDIVTKIDNHSSKVNGGIKIVVHLRDNEDTPHLVPKLMRSVADNITLRFNVTVRLSTEVVLFKETTLIEYLKSWCKWRLDLESKAQLQIAANLEKDIKHNELLIFGAENLDLMTKIIKKKEDRLNERLAEGLKVSLEDAIYLAGRTLRSYAGLNTVKLQEDNKVSKANMRLARDIAKAPTKHVVDFTKSLANQFG